MQVSAIKISLWLVNLLIFVDVCSWLLRAGKVLRHV